MDLALNNIQRLICHKTQPTNQTNKQTNQSKVAVKVVIAWIYIKSAWFSLWCFINLCNSSAHRRCVLHNGYHRKWNGQPVFKSQMRLCILFHTNALRKVTNPSVLNSSIGKLSDRLGSLALVRQSFMKKKTEFKPASLYLKIELVSDLAHSKRGWINTTLNCLFTWRIDKQKLCYYQYRSVGIKIKIN